MGYLKNDHIEEEDDLLEDDEYAMDDDDNYDDEWEEIEDLCKSFEFKLQH